VLLTACACRTPQEREAWEGRSALLYWLDLGADLALHALSLAHFLHLWCGTGALAYTCGRRVPELAPARCTPCCCTCLPPTLPPSLRRWLHGLQLQLVDGLLWLDVRFTAGALRRRLARHHACRRLHHRVRHAFPAATPAQLEAAPCCICLDRMKVGGGAGSGGSE
jgi:hypothetical protein